MMQRAFTLSIASFSVLFFALVPRVETAVTVNLPRKNGRAFKMEAETETSRPKKQKIEPPSISTSNDDGTTTTRDDGRRGLRATSTTTATGNSITTTTTMVEGEEMSPSEFRILHLRDHDLALAKESEVSAEAAAVSDTEAKYDVDDEEEHDPTQRRRRRRQRRRRELLDFVARRLQHQQQETSSPQGDDEDENDDDEEEAASEQLREEEEQVDGVNSDDVAVTITDECNVTYLEYLGDGYCDKNGGVHYDENFTAHTAFGYNTLECGWDGGDCCWQTCRDGIDWMCGWGTYDCHDPRFNNTYDEEGERDPQRRRERQALKALYQATNGDGWFDEDFEVGQWLDDKLDHCYWDTERIRCTGGEGYVWAILLQNDKLNGTLPAEIGDLLHLEVLWLFRNEHLSGTIPHSIGNLSKLIYLNISGTSLSGPVPANVMVPIFGTPSEYYSPYNTFDYGELSPDNCADVVGWVDANGNSCDSYANDTFSCATNGAQPGNMGHTADMACCNCGPYATYKEEEDDEEEEADSEHVDAAETITAECDVDDTDRLGDGWCDDFERYNTLECGWDGGDCCWQTCRDGGSRWNRCRGYDCRDPRFSVYDEKGERDPQRRRERQALKALYQATNGDGWNMWGGQRQWLNETVDHCYWYHLGIRCTTGEGYVWWIFLYDNNLNGTLPTEIGDLTNLEELSLGSNEHLSGTVPTSIGQLTKLTVLYVYGTSLSGSVPANVMELIFGKPGSYYHPDNRRTDYAQLSPHDCADVVGWVDADGNGCDWYVNDTSSCSLDGTRQGSMGHAADTACCACGLYAAYDREREVLEELYAATNGVGWHNSSFWTNGNTSHCYYWRGVECNDDGMVTNITLPSNNLRGSLPTRVGELRSLGILDVSDNDVAGGGIPTEVYTLTNLEGLHLRSTSLGGTVPTELASLSLLRRLDLSRNELGGSIPVDVTGLSLVEDLRLSHNMLTGTITPEFRRMSRLKRLDLDNNGLWGSLPVDIGLLGLLRELRISNQGYRDSNGNSHVLSGPIPVELGDLQYLEVLDLSDNRLTGFLPTELARLSRMKNLLLHNNIFEGYIPSEYGQLSRLENLTLGVYEWFYDEHKLKPAPLTLCFDEAFDLHFDPSWCPPERNALKRLYDATGGEGWSNGDNWTDPYSDHCSWYGVECDVLCRDVPNWTDAYEPWPGNPDPRGCDYYGLHPDDCDDRDWVENNNYTANTACCACQQEILGCFWNGTECRGNVTSLSLNANGLSGSLPTELGQLKHLKRLHLADNALVGGLPSEIGNLTKLGLIDLSGNALAGEFPEEIAALPSLDEVFLSRNELGGDFSIQANTNPSNLTILHFANNKFGGEISEALDQLRNFPYLREIDMSYNLFHGSMPSTPMDGITKLTAGGNERMTTPIPSSLCHTQTTHLDLDLQDSPVHCPVLSFLRLLYNLTNGANWSTPWNFEYVGSICSESLWHGITCGDTNTAIVAINLPNSGLSGTLPDSFGEHMAALSFLRVLDLSRNGLHGHIPVDFARLPLLEEVRLANNNFNGTLPVQMSNLPRLKILDVGNNRLTGTLPLEFGRLSSLRELRLSNNHFGDGGSGVPEEWGDLANIEYLDLSESFLAGEIPRELGKLGRLSHLYLHKNNFTGTVPVELGQLSQLKNLTLSGSGITPPAPLSVCALPAGVDLAHNVTFCPAERNMLKKFYDATNGNSWADKTNWLQEYGHPCDQWVGISCNNESKITKINLVGNSLYGTLGSDIFQLMELREIQLGDNRLYGTLPDFQLHTKLNVLQLSGNEFSGEIPVSIINLTGLLSLRLHANKFTKGLPSAARVQDATSDCGDPYYHGDGMLDENGCTICCNSEGKCREVTHERLTLGQKTWLYMGCLIAFLFILWAAVVLLKSRNVDLPKPPRDAFECCGPDSVYSFGLTGGYWPETFFMLLSALTIAAQFGIFSVFLQASDVSETTSDWEYFLRCPSNQLWCHPDHTVDWKGWLSFAVIMLAFLGQDFVNGVMLVYIAGSLRSTRCFLSGIIITSLTGYALWTSTQYNLAIARSNTSLIANAVIILFVNDMDEKIYKLSQWLFPAWVAGVVKRSDLAIREDIIGKKDSKVDELHEMIEKQRIRNNIMPTAESQRVAFSKRILFLEQEWI